LPSLVMPGLAALGLAELELAGAAVVGSAALAAPAAIEAVLLAGAEGAAESAGSPAAREPPVNQGACTSAPSMLASGTGTPPVPLKIEAIPIPESASMPSVKPNNLVATGAHTLARNAARFLVSHEGRAAGAT